MLSIGVYEAKTHLPDLLKRVASGETVTIENRGTPVARLVSALADDVAGRRAVIAAMKLSRGRAVIGSINQASFDAYRIKGRR